MSTLTFKVKVMRSDPIILSVDQSYGTRQWQMGSNLCPPPCSLIYMLFTAHFIACFSALFLRFCTHGSFSFKNWYLITMASSTTNKEVLEEYGSRKSNNQFLEWLIKTVPNSEKVKRTTLIGRIKRLWDLRNKLIRHQQYFFHVVTTLILRTDSKSAENSSLNSCITL